MVNIPQTDIGMASIQTEDFKTIPLFSGTVPTVTTDEVVADAVIASVDLPENSVVGFDSSGKVVLATWNATPASGVPAQGITTARVKAGATAKNVSLFRDGVFNPAALNWHSSYDTDEKKRTAFEYAGKGIYIKKPAYNA
jgi:hypothetical protein